jgi:hypothetical protein
MNPVYVYVQWTFTFIRDGKYAHTVCTDLHFVYSFQYPVAISPSLLLHSDVTVRQRTFLFVKQ